jgi:hypothetical protein
MANFVLKEVTAVGTPSVLEDGSLTQTCMVVTEIQGIKSKGKILNDINVFEVDNSIMANQSEPLNVAWSYIKDVLAPQFVLDNYSDLD